MNLYAQGILCSCCHGCFLVLCCWWRCSVIHLTELGCGVFPSCLFLQLSWQRPGTDRLVLRPSGCYNTLCIAATHGQASITRPFTYAIICQNGHSQLNLCERNGPSTPYQGPSATVICITSISFIMSCVNVIFNPSELQICQSSHQVAAVLKIPVLLEHFYLSISHQHMCPKSLDILHLRSNCKGAVVAQICCRFDSKT